MSGRQDSQQKKSYENLRKNCSLMLAPEEFQLLSKSVGICGVEIKGKLPSHLHMGTNPPITAHRLPANRTSIWHPPPPPPKKNGRLPSQIPKRGITILNCKLRFFRFFKVSVPKTKKSNSGRQQQKILIPAGSLTSRFDNPLSWDRAVPAYQVPYHQFERPRQPRLESQDRLKLREGRVASLCAEDICRTASTRVKQAPHRAGGTVLNVCTHLRRNLLLGSHHFLE